MGLVQGKVAIVTGGARGIGRATAEQLVAQGAKVVINDLDIDLARQTARDIGGETIVFGGDLTKPEIPDQLVQMAVENWGQLDIIVNNAGYAIDGPIHKVSDEQFQAMLDIHVLVPFRILRAAAPYLREPAKREREQGREVFRKVVNVTSTSGTQGNAAQVSYASAKSGIVGLTKALAKEWGQFKINVNVVAFGVIDTRLTALRNASNVLEKDGEKIQLGVTDTVRTATNALIPLGRPGTAQEAAGAIFFLCSPWSDYVHGQVLTVNGGHSFGMTS